MELNVMDAKFYFMNVAIGNGVNSFAPFDLFGDIENSDKWSVTSYKLNATKSIIYIGIESSI